MKKFNLLLLGFLFSVVMFTSCAKIKYDSSVTVTNTFQSEAFTSGSEKPIEELFQMAEGSLAATATVSDDVEFKAYLLGLYDIDINKKEISFTVVAQEGDATYGDLYRVLEAGTVDRYYLTFDKDQKVDGFTSSDSAVKLRVDSDKVLVVEIGEGFDFKPGASFTITLE